MKYSLRGSGTSHLKGHLTEHSHFWCDRRPWPFFRTKKKTDSFSPKLWEKKNNSFFRPRTDDRGTKHCAAIYLLQRVPFSDFVADETKAKKRPKTFWPKINDGIQKSYLLFFDLQSLTQQKKPSSIEKEILLLPLFCILFWIIHHEVSMGQNVKANTFEFKTVRNLHHSERKVFHLPWFW